MKKLKYVILTVILIFCMNLTVSASGFSGMMDADSEFTAVVSQFTDGGHIVDLSGVLNSQIIDSLEETAALITEEYGCGVYAAYVSNVEMDDSFGSHDPATAAKNIYTKAGLGVGEESDGILLFISVYSRDYYLLTKGSYGNSVFSDFAMDEIEDDIVSYLSDNKWDEAVNVYVQDTLKYTEAAASGNPITRTNNPQARSLGLVISLILAAIISVIVSGILRSQMKTVSQKTGAREYVPQNGIQFYIRDDHYTHTTVVRTKRNTESSGRGGGGGRSSGGGSGFSGRGGKF